MSSIYPLLVRKAAVSLTAAVAFPGTSLFTVSGGKVMIYSFFARVMTTVGAGAVTIQPITLRSGGVVTQEFAYDMQLTPGQESTESGGQR